MFNNGVVAPLSGTPHVYHFMGVTLSTKQSHCCVFQLVLRANARPRIRKWEISRKHVIQEVKRLQPRIVTVLFLESVCVEFSQLGKAKDLDKFPRTSMISKNHFLEFYFMCYVCVDNIA